MTLTAPAISKSLLERLTYKQKRFARMWLSNGYNAKKAAIDAGYSPKTAHQQGYVMIRHPGILAFMELLQEETNERLDIKRDDVIREMGKVGMVSSTSLFNDRGQLRDIHDLDEDTAAAVQSVEVITKTIGSGEDMDVEYVHKIKMHDKMKALDNLGKHFNIYDDHQNSGSDKIAIVIQGKDEQA